MRLVLLVALTACGSSAHQPPDAGHADANHATDAAPDGTPDAAHVDMLAMTVNGNPHSYQGSEAKLYFDQGTNRFTIEATDTAGTNFLGILLPHTITGPTTITTCSSIADKEMDWVTFNPNVDQYTAGGASGTSCMIVLTTFGGVGTVVEGTFKGVLLNDQSVITSLNNGTFSIKRGLDH